MYVVTLDQRHSRHGEDEVPELLARLNHDRAGLVLSFERTAGDEVQGLFDDAEPVVDLLADMLRGSGWSIGIGVGATDGLPPASVREGRGDAYVQARVAVERAKTAPYPVCVSATTPDGAERAETACWLLAAILVRRSEAGWQAVDAMATHQHQKRAATRLGITPQAMSSRLRVAGYTEERRGRALITYLLRECE